MRGSYRELVPFIERIYERHSAGCCWHVVIDDYNFHTDTIERCADSALANYETNDDDQGHEECWSLAIAWRSGRYSRTSLRKAAMVSARPR